MALALLLDDKEVTTINHILCMIHDLLAKLKAQSGRVHGANKHKQQAQSVDKKLSLASMRIIHWT